MRKSPRQLAALFVVVLLWAGAAGAPPLLPPSLSIRQPENAVTVVTILERLDDGRIRVRRDEVLQEDPAVLDAGAAPPSEIVVRLGDDAATVAPGQRYILGYTTLAPVAKQKHTFTVDPEGARIYDIPSVGPALLEVSVPLRTLVTPRSEDAELGPRQRLDLILQQLERDDPRGRLFVLAEMQLWRDVANEVTAADGARLRRVVESGELEARAREYSLRVLVPLHETVGGDWLVEEARRVLAEYEPQLDLVTAGPSLVKTALETLRDLGSAQDAVPALEFLHANNDAVSVAALQAAAALDPDLTEATLTEVIWEGGLPLDTEIEATRFLAQRQAGHEPAADPDGGDG